jgi:hypothetical protein
VKQLVSFLSGDKLKLLLVVALALLAISFVFNVKYVAVSGDNNVIYTQPIVQPVTDLTKFKCPPSFARSEGSDPATKTPIVVCSSDLIILSVRQGSIPQALNIQTATFLSPSEVAGILGR